MDFSSISLAGPIAQILSLALVVVAGYAAIWAVNKVIDVARDDPNDPSNYDHDVFSDDYFNPSPPTGGFTDYDPNGNYHRRDGMWRKNSDFY